MWGESALAVLHHDPLLRLLAFLFTAHEHLLLRRPNIHAVICLCAKRSSEEKRTVMSSSLGMLCCFKSPIWTLEVARTTKHENVFKNRTFLVYALKINSFFFFSVFLYFSVRHQAKILSYLHTYIMPLVYCITFSSHLFFFFNCSFCPFV